MDELRTHLNGNTSRIFRPEELNEIILMVYGVLRRAVLEQCDTLTLTPAAFTWSKQGTPIGTFRIVGVKPAMSFRTALQTVVARDSVVQRHLQLVVDSPQQIDYRIQDVPTLQTV